MKMKQPKGVSFFTALAAGYKNDTVYLLSIFDKSDVENLSDKEILELIKLIQ
jgi:hypothetical protein